MLDGLGAGIGSAISGMPPTLAAIVIMGLAVVGLVIVWRRSGAEAVREKDRADAAEKSGLHGKLDGLHGKLDTLADEVDTIKGGVALIMDRVKR